MQLTWQTATRHYAPHEYSIDTHSGAVVALLTKGRLLCVWNMPPAGGIFVPVRLPRMAGMGRVVNLGNTQGNNSVF